VFFVDIFSGEAALPMPRPVRTTERSGPRKEDPIMQPLSPARKKRLDFVVVIFGVLLAAIIYKSARLQIVEREYWVKEASKTTQRIYRLSSVRGEIFDRNGEKLAASVATQSVFVDGKILKDKGESAYRLYQALDIDFEDLARRMEGDRSHLWIKRDISPEEAKAVSDLKIRGVGLQKEYRREYPNGSLAAHFLGFVGRDGQGLEGLELALEDKLNVPSVKVRVRQDAKRRPIIEDPEQALSQPKGASVMLTIDRRIQHIVEKAISKAVVERNAKSGLAIVVRPRTGEILASAVYPTFDPNDYASVDGALRTNRILTDPFEPGSTFKVFTVAAALEEKMVTPDTVFFCENGNYKVDGNTVIRDTGNYGDLSVSKIVQKSSNIGASKIGERLGAKRLHNYLTRFAFGEKTGLAYPSGESAGRLRESRDWRVVEAANIAFGQGLSVTALQLVMAAAALGNDGVLMRPTLVSRVVDSEGRVIEQIPPQIVRQVVSPLTANQVLAMMRLAVMKGGTGRKGDIPQYPVAGKTGTAQSVEVGHSTYSATKYVASFVGLAPYHNPELCTLVVLFEPYPSYFGGEVAAPVFKEIMAEALPLLDVPPQEAKEDEVQPLWPSLDKPDHGAPGVLPDNRSVNFVMVKLPKGDKGDSRPIEPFGQDVLEAEASLDFDAPLAQAKDRLILPEDDGQAGVMPDLSGLSMRQVLDLMSPFRLSLEFQGSGLAVGQEPARGSPVERGQPARVLFAGKRS
jgi:cell division protein FtsI (penicillin-binding protein 3)